MESLIEETEFSASYYSLLKRLLEKMNKNKIVDPREQMSAMALKHGKGLVLQYDNFCEKL